MTRLESTVIALEKINKVYTQNQLTNNVLNNLDLVVNKGDLITIQGPSGSGKSTLLNIIGLIDNDFDGKYMFGSIDVKHASYKEKNRFRLEKIGFIFQTFNLIDSLNVEDNVQYPLALLGYSQEEQRERADRYLKKLKINHKKESYINEISAGERQRVAIARAFAKNPSIVLADEPTGDLDRQNTQNFVQILGDIIKDEPNLATIVVSHNPDVLAIGKKRYSLVDGKLLYNI